jgi:hypothetical protein
MPIKCVAKTTAFMQALALQISENYVPEGGIMISIPLSVDALGLLFVLWALRMLPQAHSRSCPIPSIFNSN